jgi:CRISPR-associated protein Cas5d
MTHRDDRPMARPARPPREPQPLYPTYKVRIRGEMACFTRPELAVERVSYSVITPSAARGIIEAIYWKPAFRWHVTRIAVLKPIRMISFRRNEVQSKPLVKDVIRMMRGGPRSYIDVSESQERIQRGTLALRDVDYHVYVTYRPTGLPGGGRIKVEQMFQRRLGSGQYHMSPYLGCREFPAIVTAAGDDDPEPIPDSQGFGPMLLDMDYGPPIRPLMFNAVMHRGIIEVPEVPPEATRPLPLRRAD